MVSFLEYSQNDKSMEMENGLVVGRRQRLGAGRGVWERGHRKIEEAQRSPFLVTEQFSVLTVIIMQIYTWYETR